VTTVGGCDEEAVAMRYRQVLWVAVAVDLTFGAGPAAATVKLPLAMDEMYTTVGISPPTAAHK
jgi:hypothetical protein